MSWEGSPIEDSGERHTGIAAEVEGLLPRVIVALFSGVDDPLADTPGSQLRILRLLVARARSLKELGAELGMGASSTTQMVNRLEVAGFVVRRTDAQDRRIRQIELSEVGKGLMEARIAARVQRGGMILSSIPPEVTARLVEALHAVLAAANEIKLEQPAQLDTGHHT